MTRRLMAGRVNLINGVAVIPDLANPDPPVTYEVIARQPNVAVGPFRAQFQGLQASLKEIHLLPQDLAKIRGVVYTEQPAPRPYARTTYGPPLRVKQ